jgi:hypothetical protein
VTPEVPVHEVDLTFAVNVEGVAGPEMSSGGEILTLPPIAQCNEPLALTGVTFADAGPAVMASPLRLSATTPALTANLRNIVSPQTVPTRGPLPTGQAKI